MAQEWARSVESQIDKMQFNDPRELSNIQLSNLIDRYIAEIGSVKKFGDTKRHTLNKFKLSLGNLPMSELTADKMTEYVLQRSKVVVGATIAVELAYLGDVLKTAKELWRIPVDTTVAATGRANLKYIGLSPKGK